MDNKFRFIVYGATDSDEYKVTALAGAKTPEQALAILDNYYTTTRELFYNEDGEKLVLFGIYDSEKQAYLRISDLQEYDPFNDDEESED